MPAKTEKKTGTVSAAVKKSAAAASDTSIKSSSAKSPAKSVKTSAKNTASGYDQATKIQKRAYELWQSRQGGHGDDWSDWLRAEKEVKEGKV